MIAINKWGKLLWVLVIIFAAAKLILAANGHYPGWDESVYAGMGKYLYSAGSSGLWEAARPIGLPLVLGLIWKLGLPFGLLAEIAMTAFAAGSLLLTYATAKKLFNAPSGILSVLLLGSSTLFFAESSKLMTEAPSAFFVLLSLFLLMKKNNFAAGLAAAMAAMFKFPNLLLLLPLSIFLLQQYRESGREAVKKAAMTAAGYFAVILPFLAANYIAYGSPIEPFTLAAAHQSNALNSVQGLFQNLLFYAIALLKQNIFFIFLPIGAIAMLREKSGKGKNLLFAYIAAYFIYLTYIPNKQERFMLLLLPAAAILAAYGFYYFIVKLKGSSKSSAAIVFAILLAAGVTGYGIIAEDAKLYATQNEGAYELAVNGTILASNPIFAYYNDNKFVPYYFSSADGKKGIEQRYKNFERNFDAAEAIIFSENDFYCNEEDSYCRQKLQAITERMNETGKAVIKVN